MKDKNVAAFLAFFLGMLGAQKVYLNQWGAFGLILMVTVLTLGLIPFLFGVIDAIRLIQMDWQQFNEKYNRRYRNDYLPMD